MASKDANKSSGGPSGSSRNPPAAPRGTPSVRLPPLEERLRRVAEEIAEPASMRERVLQAIGQPIHGPDDPRLMRYVDRLLAAIGEPIHGPDAPVTRRSAGEDERGDARSRSPRDRAARGLSITRVIIKTTPPGRDHHEHPLLRAQ